MSEKLIKKELEEIFPKENTKSYRAYLVNKYGEEEVVKMEKVNSIVAEVLNSAIADLMK